MRKILTLAAGAALLAGLMTPAEAATRTYTIVFDPAPRGKTDVKSNYNDTALDVSEDTVDGRQKTTIKGRVKRGKKPATGRVNVWATNMSTKAKKRTWLGSARLSKRGTFTKAFNPGHDNAGLYRIEVVKSGSRGYATRTKAFTIRVFQFVSMANFFVEEASNPETIEPPLADGEDPLVMLNPPYDRTRGVGSVAGELAVSANYWATSYSIRGTGTAVFDFRGQTCMQWALKLGVWKDGPTGADTGTFAVKIGSKTLASETRTKLTLKNGLYYFDATKDARGPNKDLGQDVNGKVRSLFTVTATQEAYDPMARDLRFILGRPMVLCTYPINNPK